MQTLTAMTLGALVLGAAAFAYDATAKSASCTEREASVRFEGDKAEIDDFSKAVVERMAAEAKACGVDTVVAKTTVDGRHAAALNKAFRPMGVRVVLTRSSAPTAGIGGVRLAVGQDA